MRPEPGLRLGEYELIRPIGAGAMGEVWLAREPRLDRLVALKLLAPAMAGDHSRLARFRQEARAASALNHPNVCHIYALGDALDGLHYIAMEFVQGETLRSRLNTSALTISDAVDIAVQISSALSAAHSIGIIHRDIKPENVIVGPSGTCKVLDFGLAKLTATVAPASTASTSTAVHTEDYTFLERFPTCLRSRRAVRRLTGERTLGHWALCSMK